jgi:predicted naringenin-chalcone synthase
VYEYLFYTDDIHRTDDMKHKPAIVSIGLADLPYTYTKTQMLAYMQQHYGYIGKDAEKLRLIYERSGIASKQSVLPDFQLSNDSNILFADSSSIPSTSARSEIYFRFAAELASQAVVRSINGKISKEEITHLITVSCTGMAAPGLDLMVCEQLALPSSVYRTSVNFMGCYAAFHALKMANHICVAESSANVIIVSIELCSLHYQPDSDFETIASNLLFADGCAAALVSNNFDKGDKIILQAFGSEIIYQGKKDMAWQISEKGFLMTLSAYIPTLLSANMRPLVVEFLKNYNTELKDINTWAIHPGGKKILDMLMTSLEASQDKFQYSYKILSNYGNMSSATILYVLKLILEDKSNQGLIFSAAFGPGITVEMGLLEKVSP